MNQDSLRNLCQFVSTMQFWEPRTSESLDEGNPNSPGPRVQWCLKTKCVHPTV